MDKEISSSAWPESVSQIEAREQRLRDARRFNLLSNVFMAVALNDKAACQYVLRILTGLNDLVVKEVRSQYRISKIESHDAILDILAEDSHGKLYNIEIQRSETIDHARRTRFYGAMIDSTYLEKGKTYAELPEVFIIYISETDLWKAGRTAYTVEKRFAGTDVPYDDGQHILYVNAAINDGSEAAKLMQYFKSTDENDMSHGDLSKRVHLLKCEEGGYQEMCEITDKLIHEGILIGEKKGIAIGEKKGIAIGEKNGKMKMAFRLADKGMPIEEIAEAAEVDASMVRQWLHERRGTAIQ